MATCLRHNINTTLFITSKAGGNTQAPVDGATNISESTITQFWETLREIFNVSGTGNVCATATQMSEPRHKGSKDTDAGRQRHKTPTRKHVSVS